MVAHQMQLYRQIYTKRISDSVNKINIYNQRR